MNYETKPLFRNGPYGCQPARVRGRQQCPLSARRPPGSAPEWSSRRAEAGFAAEEATSACSPAGAESPEANRPVFERRQFDQRRTAVRLVRDGRNQSGHCRENPSIALTFLALFGDHLLWRDFGEPIKYPTWRKAFSHPIWSVLLFPGNERREYRSCFHRSHFDCLLFLRAVDLEAAVS